MEVEKGASQIINQISQISTISNEVLLKIDREVSILSLPWTEVYKEYQSSGWKTVSLLSRTGEATDLIIDDCVPKETDVLHLLPTLKNFLNELNLKYMWARLARLEPNGYLWEHRDYTELNSKKRLRLHIPIQTNKDAHIILFGHQINLGYGYIWKLDPQMPHGACNTGPTARIHLIIDCYIDKKLESLVESQWLDHKFINVLPNTKSAKKEEVVARNLTKLQFYQTAERILLKTYHSRFEGEGACYDKIIKMYQELGQFDKSQIWLSRKNQYLAHGINA